MHILILNKVVGPNVVGIGRCEWQRTLTAQASTFWSLHLQTSTLPLPMDALAIDGTFAPQQRPDSSIAVARMCLGKRRDLALYPVIRERTRLILEARTLELHQHTGALHRHALRAEEAHRFSSFCDAHPFFPRNSLSASTSSIRSARSRLSRAFSFSNSLRRWASLTDIPP